MDQKLTTPSPFSSLKIRTLVLLLVATFPFLILTIALGKKIFGISDALFETIVTTFWFYGIVMLWMYYQFKRKRISWKRLIGSFPDKFDWFANLILLLCMLIFNFGSLFSSLGLLSFIFPDFAVNFMNDHPNTQSTFPGLFLLADTISAVLIAPFVEELLMRGVLLHRFKYKWGIKWALLFAASVFAVGHSNIVGMFMVALVLSLLYLKYKTLIVPMFFHAMNNTVVSLLQLFSGGSSSNKPITLSDIQTSVWFGIVLVLLSLPVLLQFLIKNWPKQDMVMPYDANSSQNPS